ncbi:MAG: DUF6364 family protein [Bacteroidia bacterium]
MDQKVTLRFDEAIVRQAKAFAAANNISLSRLVEYLLSRSINASYKSLDELPVSDWVNMVSEGEVVYRRTPRSGKEMKEEFRTRKKKG